MSELGAGRHIGLEISGWARTGGFIADDKGQGKRTLGHRGGQGSARSRQEAAEGRDHGEGRWDKLGKRVMTRICGWTHEAAAYRRWARVRPRKPRKEGFVWRAAGWLHTISQEPQMRGGEY